MRENPLGSNVNQASLLRRALGAAKLTNPFQEEASASHSAGRGRSLIWINVCDVDVQVHREEGCCAAACRA